MSIQTVFIRDAVDVVKWVSDKAHNLRAPLHRELIARAYVKGAGIEIGALHYPLRVPRQAKVRYVDRMTVPDLRKHYPELRIQNLVPVDIIDDGETLHTIADATQDFVIANHFLEHCQNPIGAIDSMLRVLKDQGIIYLAIPDKRYIFDRDRPVTPIEHHLRDYQQGPGWARKAHFEEYARLVHKVQEDAEVDREVKRLMDADYSIHYHTWTQLELLHLLVIMRQQLGLRFELELFLKNGGEMICILRKATAMLTNDGDRGRFAGAALPGALRSRLLAVLRERVSDR